MDIGLLVSNDGIHFREPIPDFQLISRGTKGSWDRGSLWGVSFHNMADSTYIYYGALDGGVLDYTTRGAIGLASLPRDRFGYLSLKVPGQTGVLMTSPMVLGGKVRIFVNGDGLEPGVNIALGLLDERYQPVPGYSLEESQPIIASGLRQAVSWTRGEIVEGLKGKKVVLQARLEGKGDKSPRLYAVYVVAAP